MKTKFWTSEDPSEALIVQNTDEGFLILEKQYDLQYSVRSSLLPEDSTFSDVQPYRIFTATGRIDHCLRIFLPWDEDLRIEGVKTQFVAHTTSILSTVSFAAKTLSEFLEAVSQKKAFIVKIKDLTIFDASLKARGKRLIPSVNHHGSSYFKGDCVVDISKIGAADSFGNPIAIVTKNVSAQQKEEIFRLYAEKGMSTITLGRKYNCSPETIRTWMRKAGIDRRPQYGAELPSGSISASSQPISMSESREPSAPTDFVDLTNEDYLGTSQAIPAAVDLDGIDTCPSSEAAIPSGTINATSQPGSTSKSQDPSVPTDYVDLTNEDYPGIFQTNLAAVDQDVRPCMPEQYQKARESCVERIKPKVPVDQIQLVSACLTPAPPHSIRDSEGKSPTLLNEPGQKRSLSSGDPTSKEDRSMDEDILKILDDFPCDPAAFGEEVDIKDLVVENNKDSEGDSPTPLNEPEQRTRPNNILTNEPADNDKSEELALSERPNFVTDLDDLDTKVRSLMITSENVLWRGNKNIGRARICTICGKEGPVTNIMSHIESNHMAGIAIPCDICGKAFKSRNSLNKHRRHYHTRDGENQAQIRFKPGPSSPSLPSQQHSGNLTISQVQSLVQKPSEECEVVLEVHNPAPASQSSGHIPISSKEQDLNPTKFLVATSQGGQVQNKSGSQPNSTLQLRTSTRTISNLPCLLCKKTFGHTIALQNHLAQVHFRKQMFDKMEKIKMAILLPTECPIYSCGFIGNNKMHTMLHFACYHKAINKVLELYAKKNALESTPDFATLAASGFFNSSEPLVNHSTCPYCQRKVNPVHEQFHVVFHHLREHYDKEIKTGQLAFGFPSTKCPGFGCTRNDNERITRNDNSISILKHFAKQHLTPEEMEKRLTSSICSSSPAIRCPFLTNQMAPCPVDFHITGQEDLQAAYKHIISHVPHMLDDVQKLITLACPLKPSMGHPVDCPLKHCNSKLVDLAPHIKAVHRF